MEILKKVNALVLGLAVLVAVGCGGEEPEPVNALNTEQQKRLCLVTNSSTFISDYSYEYTYNNNNEVVKARRFSPVSYLNNYDLVTYSSNGLIQKVKTYNSNNSIVNLRTFNYSPDLLIKTETIYALTDPSDTTDFYAVGYYEYSYNASQQITQMTYFIANQPSAPHLTYTFLYRPDGSIEMTYFNNTAGVLDRKTEYFFANNLPSRNKVQYFKLFTGLFNPISGIIGYEFPVKLVEKHYNRNDGSFLYENRSEYSYTYNADGYPTEQLLTFPVQQIPRKSYWTYNCQ